MSNTIYWLADNFIKGSPSYQEIIDSNKKHKKDKKEYENKIKELENQIIELNSKNESIQKDFKQDITILKNTYKKEINFAVWHNNDLLEQISQLKYNNKDNVESLENYKNIIIKLENELKDLLAYNESLSFDNIALKSSLSKNTTSVEVQTDEILPMISSTSTQTHIVDTQNAYINTDDFSNTDDCSDTSSASSPRFCVEPFLNSSELNNDSIENW